MTNTHFKNSVLALSNAASNVGVFLNTYELLNLAEALVEAGVNFAEPTTIGSTHETRVRDALNNAEVMQHMRDGKKISAIKALRLLTNCGLKEAKDAVEDSRVIDASGYRSYYGY